MGAVCLCGYLLFFRVHGIEESFWLYAEQVRDWRMTQAALSELPLSGPRSLNSGADIGPAYYWYLWWANAVLSPILGEFPHTGAWANALIHTAADFGLLLVLWKRFESWTLAAGIVLLLGTAPHDAGLTGTVWNPPAAVAFVKLAVMATLWRERPTALSSSLAIAAAWVAVQMHLSAIVVALPVTVWIAYSIGSYPTRARIAAGCLTLAASLFLVLLPYAVNPLRSGDAGVAQSLQAVAQHPAARLRVVESAGALAWAIDVILATPFAFRVVSLLAFAGSVVVVFTQPLSGLAATTTGVLASAVLVFSLWQGDFNELYWFAVAVPPAAVACAALFGSLAPAYRHAAGALLLAVTFAAQPARSELAWQSFRWAHYGALRRGAEAIASSGRQVRNIRTEFELPPQVEPGFMLDLAGGRISADSRDVAVIDRAGSVRYVEE